MPREDGWKTWQEMLTANGYYNKWHSQVMADIFLPEIADRNPSWENEYLDSYKYVTSVDDCGYQDKLLIGEHQLALYLVREFFRNLGLVSTDKIFEEEAGLHGTEVHYQTFLKNYFDRFSLSTPRHLEPPMLHQLLYLIMYKHRKAIDAQEVDPDRSRRVFFGVPQNMGQEIVDQFHHDESVRFETNDFDDEGECSNLIWRIYSNPEYECSETGHCGM